MSKSQNFQELLNFLVVGLRHKIGSLVNNLEVYAQKYAKDADVLLNEARKTCLKENWNYYDKLKIKEELKKKLRQELEAREFLSEKKFEIMDAEIIRILKELDLFIS